MITKRTMLMTVSAAVLALGAGALWMNGIQPNDKAAALKQVKRIPIVSVTVPQVVDLPIRFSAQGHFVALNQIDIRPQLNGIIRGVHFKEGNQVQAGQLLFTLDSTETEAQFNRVMAQSAQIREQLAEAGREHKRSQELVKEGFISSSAVDTNGSKVVALQAQLKASLADVESARVQVARTRIVSPITARAGAIVVYPGSMAQQSAVVPLVTLAQFDPIGVDFSLPEQALSAILAAGDSTPLKVTLKAADNSAVEGTLTFINYTVNRDSGTINLKASFPNKNHHLWPGAFTRIQLNAGINKGALVLPPQAVLEGPNGRFVYLVGSDNKIVAKPVTLLGIEEQHAVIHGLQGGEQVVLEGDQDVRAGVLVRLAVPGEAKKVSKVASGVHP